MKKFLSLMIISLMILSCFTLTAFAEGETITWIATAPNTDGTFTLSASVNFVSTGITAAFKYDSSKLEYVSCEYNTAYDSKDISDTDSMIFVSTSASANTVAADDSMVKLTFKTKDKITDTTDLFKLPDATSSDYENSEGGVVVADDNYGYFALDTKVMGSDLITAVWNLDSLVTSDPKPEDWTTTVKDTTTGDIKFPETSDKIGTDNDADLKTDADVKKVVIFAKAVDALTGTKDGSANYGITIGGMYYPGYLSVPAGSNWSIILVDPNNTLTDSYSASVTVGSETKTLENVSFK